DCLFWFSADSVLRIAYDARILTVATGRVPKISCFLSQEVAQVLTVLVVGYNIASAIPYFPVLELPSRRKYYLIPGHVDHINVDSHIGPGLYDVPMNAERKPESRDGRRRYSVISRDDSDRYRVGLKSLGRSQ